MNIKDTVLKLCDIPGVSGFEHDIAKEVSSLFSMYCDRTEIDKMGNVYGFLSCGKENAPKILLDAHMDQIGFIVTDVLDDGFLRFAPIGGVDYRMLLGLEVKILAEKEYFGVISCKPPHLIKASEANKSVQINDMVIDTGFKDAKGKIPIGTSIIFSEPAFASSNSIFGKALDDRAGIVCLLHALYKLSGKEICADIIVVSSISEEIGLLGATLAGYNIRPDYCIAVDVTHGKTPDAPAGRAFDISSGVMIGMGPNLNKKLTNSLISLAKSEEISYGLEIMEGHTGTNAWAYQISCDGIPTALLSLPLKYMHSPIEMVSIKDIKAVSELIFQYILNFTKEDDHA